MLHSVLFPPSVAPGAPIRVIAPSGAVDRAAVEKSLAWLANRYTVRPGRHLFCRDKYLAGTDEQRREDLLEALADPESQLILCARGGFGCSRLLDQVDLAQLHARPQWLVGFSDITALHLAAQQLGIATIHADNAQSLAHAGQQRRAEWIRAVEEPQQSRALSNLVPLADGRAKGTLTGGNLAIVHDAAASGRLRLPPQCILFLEDVGERPYRVDRMLTALLAGGHLSMVRAVCLGSFTGTGAAEDEFHEAVRSALSGLDVPILAGIPAGHGESNTPLVMGSACEVTACGRSGQLRMAAHFADHSHQDRPLSAKGAENQGGE